MSTASNDPAADQWLHPGKASTAPRVRLVCLPYAGGGTATFHAWPARLPADVEVRPVRLPGREDRLTEPAYTDMDALVHDLCAGLAPLYDPPAVPLAFFGHSMGALIAFELCRRLADRAPVARLIVSGHGAPHLPATHRLHTLPDEQLVSAIGAYGGLRPEVLESPELRKLFLATLRADFQLVETYRHTKGDPLELAISTWSGSRDDNVPFDQVAEWNGYSTQPVRHRIFPGGHFFLDHGDVLRVLAEELAG
jgi:medium-chain acyl-[acyl-carrier-protein] hydrolase